MTAEMMTKTAMKIRRVISCFFSLKFFDSGLIKSMVTVEEEVRTSDGSNEAYKTLDPSLKRVYDRIPSDIAVSIDRLTGDGLGVGEVISALTLLEIEGLVVSLPGGLYSKA